jgi:hypothetical protein
MLISDEPDVEAICREGLFVRVLFRVTATTGEQARITSSRIELVVRIGRLFRNECRPKYFYTEWTQVAGSARTVYEALSKGVRLLKSRSSRSPHELEIEEEFFRRLRKNCHSSCGLLQNQFRNCHSLHDVKTNTGMCRMIEYVAENSL